MAVAPINVEVRPLRFPHAHWFAAWPRDRAALTRGLAVAAAYPRLVGPLLVRLQGDAEATLAGVLEDLAEQGIGAEDLPPVQLLPVQEPDASPCVADLPAALARGCEYDRRPWLPVLPEGDERHREVWEAAAAIVAEGRTATLVVESLTGCDAVQDVEAVRLVAANPALRREARKLGLSAVPRPPAARHLPQADAVVADARRPDDLALVSGADAEIVLVCADRLSALARETFGITAAAPFADAVAA